MDKLTLSAMVGLSAAQANNKVTAVAIAERVATASTGPVFKVIRKDALQHPG